MQYINTQQLSLFVPENKRVGDSFFLFVTGDVKRLMDYQFVGSRIMILVKKGTLSLVINGNSRVMREKSYADILDGTMIRFTEMSEDAEIFCAFTTKSFLLDAFQGVMPEPRDYTFKVLVDPVVNLEKSCRFEGMCCQMELLYSIISDTGHRYRTDLVKLYVKAFVLELSNALLDQFADFGGIQLHAPVPLRLQDVCKALKTAAYAAINDHITRSDDYACHYRLIDFAIQLNFA